MHLEIMASNEVGCVRSSQEIPDKADSDGFMEIPKQLELEIPFK